MINKTAFAAKGAHGFTVPLFDEAVGDLALCNCRLLEVVSSVIKTRPWSIAERLVFTK